MMSQSKKNAKSVQLDRCALAIHHCPSPVMMANILQWAPQIVQTALQDTNVH
jgi:hypothetical protein